MTRNRKRLTPILAATAVLAVGLSATAFADPSDPAAAPANGLTAEQRADIETRFASLGDATPVGETSAAPESEAAQAATGNLAFTEKASLETDNGLGALAEVGGTHGDQVLINNWGTVTRLDDDQEVVWRRTPSTLWTEWNLTAVRPWDRGIPAFRVYVGTSATSSVGDYIDRGYALGDLNGDGVDDIAFISMVGDSPSYGVKFPDTKMTQATFVDVLDGRTGATIWQQRHTNARMVQIVDGTLIVADQPNGNRTAPADALARTYAYTFTTGGGALTATNTWTVDAASRASSWNVLEPLGNGRVALSWSEPASTQQGGHLMVLDAATGAAVWNVATPQPIRNLGLDARRGLLAATEQATYTADVQYELVTFGLADGARTVLGTRVNALPTAMTVADITGGRDAEYVVAEALPDAIGYMHAAQIRATDGRGAQLWTYTVKRNSAWSKDGPLVFGLHAADGTVLASWLDDTRKGEAGARTVEEIAGIAALSGRDGEVRWEKRGGPIASPIYALLEDGHHGTTVATVSVDQTRHVYRLSDGREVGKTPLYGEFSQLVTYDINGDGVRDLITGGYAHGVLAFDGAHLGPEPKLLWRATTAGSVHDLELADVTGSSRPEVVVAASDEAVVLDVRDGDVESAFGDGNGLVWTVEVGDIDRDDDAEIVIPTDGVRAYNGDGRRLWTYGADADLVYADVAIADDSVYGMYVTRQGVESRRLASFGLDGERGRKRWSVDGDPSLEGTISLWNGVQAGDTLPFADGHGVAFAFGSTAKDTGFEVRDGRTGELLGSAGGTSGAGLAHQLTSGPDGFWQARAAQLARIAFDGTTSAKLVIANPFAIGFTTGPNGEQLVVSANEGYLSMWETSMLESPNTYPDDLDSTVAQMEAWNMAVVDLDGDGVDEVIGLAHDAIGYDLMLDAVGAGFWSSSIGREGIQVFQITAA
ncbi:hypothetical protein [Phytomonospora endophytica]|uniref:VCBS repeat-containing protein n=1 Tax=Phytomonospora endophytica TaxID=714109 RepID=A0A841F858_9ACTN|nr:hypothetical protein [Phytomonospora endophytica]MBB6032406.1 hypothetical protein [Phytomonospora endophytica]GIG71380.1 hypothetical protein Pen01_76750 [Phytomonospora endophytica]